MTVQSHDAAADYWDSFADFVLASDEQALYRRAAMMLSVCLTAADTDLHQLLEEVWPDENTHVAETVERLLRAPFVERTAVGWRMNVSLAPRIAGRFLKEDRAAFERAHKLLRAREEQQLAAEESADEETDPSEVWFTKTRLAFYLAGLNSGEAASQFGHAFETAPRREQSAARIWLSTLVLRQAPLLGDHLRVVRFFEGFRFYVAGRKAEAGQLFSEVVEGKAEDAYQAIALHLKEICTRRTADRIPGLTDSVALSDQLGLHENEVMARNSLIFAHLAHAMKAAAEGGDEAAQPDLDAAHKLAQVNYERSQELADKSYEAYALTQLAQTLWRQVSGVRAKSAESPEATTALPQVIATLESAIKTAESAGLVDPALSATNKCALVLKEVGRTSEALLKLESVLPRIGLATDLGILRQLAKTAGSLASLVPANLAGRLAKLRKRLDAEIGHVADG